VNIAQAILAKPHHRETAAEIFERAEKVETARKNYWKKTNEENKKGSEKNDAA